METRRNVLGIEISNLVAEMGRQKYQILSCYHNSEKIEKQNFDADDIKRGMEWGSPHS